MTIPRPFTCPAGNGEPGGEPCKEREGGAWCAVKGIVEASGGTVDKQTLWKLCFRRRQGLPPSNPLDTPRNPRRG